MNRKVIDVLFALLVFSLPFIFLPRIFWQSFLGGPFGADLVVYPLLIGFIYTVYCQWKYRNVFYKWNTFKKFILAYLAVLLVSLAWGLINYPYYDQIMNGPVSQIEKLPAVMALLAKIGLHPDEKLVLQLWMFARPIKGVFFEVLYTFGGAYMIFCWYHDRVERAFEILLKVVTVDVIIVAAYGLVDICYQNGQMWAQNFLTTVNPLIHSRVPKGSGFWPPILWNGQLRSLFTEPSYFGIYMAFAFPLLWWNLCKTSGKARAGYLALLLVLLFELFISKARTSMALFLGEIVLLALFTLYLRNRRLLVRAGLIMLCCAASFGGSMYFMGHYQVVAEHNEPLATLKAERIASDEKQKNKKAELLAKDFVDSSLLSLVDQSKAKEHAGSNHSRYTIIKTHIQIGAEHPLLGIGTSLRQGYLREKLDKDPGEEIQTWNKMIDQNGLLRGTYANLGDFALRFAETGVLGIGLFLLPALVLIYRFAYILIGRKVSYPDVLPFLFVGISFAGTLARGVGDGLNITFCYWFIMGMSYILYYGTYKKEQNTL